jgi:threonine dehydrogenase-like Zn-dependent dehydrogenase
MNKDKVDTSFLLSRRMSLEAAPTGYKMFKDRQNEVTRVVLKPDGETRY